MKRITILIILVFAIELTHCYSQNAWTQSANFGGTSRYGAVGFSISSKGYIGTGYDTGYKNDFWEYDPATNTWTQKANFGGSARFSAVGFSIESKGYIGTGDDVAYTKDFWEYDPVANTWTKKASFGGSARYWSTGFSIGSKGYIGLGNNSSGYKNDFWEYDPATNTWLQKASFSGTARGAATGFSIEDKGYIGTGYDGSYKKDFWEYDPATNLWTAKANFGGVARYEAVGFSIGSKGYTGTGSNGTLKSDFWEYTPANDTWTEKANFGGTARYRAVGFSNASKGYIGTGFDNNNKNDFWEYTSEECFGLTVYADSDGDSYGDPANSYFALDCVAPSGYVLNGTDCNDTNSGIHPAACDGINGVDDNCNGVIDDGSGATTYYTDADGDGFGTGTGTPLCSNPGAGYSTNKTNCNDTNSSIHPGVCDDSNGVDDNCDGDIDYGSGAVIYYADSDGDAYGAGNGTSFCSNPGPGYSINNTDCDDNNFTTHPYACDGTNGVDNNCNGVIDDGSGAITYYIDEDHDGYGTGPGILLCNPGAGYSYNNTDCADTDASISPGLSEVINGIDDNCDGIIDANYWTQKTDFGYNSPYVEPKPRTGAAGFAIDSKWYIGTGYLYEGTSHYYKDFWEYDPATNAWTQKTDFGGVGRTNAICFSIAGKGYIGTGSSYDGTSHYYKDFWEYDPAVNAWTQKNDFGGTARQGAIGFTIGNKGYAGTGSNYDGVSNYYKDFWEYDPAADTWTQKGDFGGAGRSSAVGFSIGTQGYIGTGIYYSNELGYISTKDFWEYDPASDLWTQKANFGGYQRYAAVGFGIGDKGYIGTGTFSGIYLKDFWEYNPVADIWTQKSNFGGTAREGAVGFSIGSKGYLGTGYNFDTEQYSKDFWEYDPNENSWIKKPDFGASTRYGAVGFSISNKGYLGTGVNIGDLGYIFYKDFWEYDPLVNSWTQKADFGGTARSGAVGFSISGNGYLGTGNNYSDGQGYTFYKDFWEYDPALNTWTQKADFGGTAREGAVGFSIGNKGYLGTGSSTMDFWEYDPIVNTWMQKADYGGGDTRYGTGFSIDNKGYIGTGYDPYVGLKNDFWEYDPDTDIWIKKANFIGWSRMSSVGFSIGSKGYIGTGVHFNVYYGGYFSRQSLNDFFEYDPTADTWTQKAYFSGTPRQNAVGFSIGNKGYIGTGYYEYDYYEAYFSDFWEYSPETIVSDCPLPSTASTVNITSTKATLKWLGINEAASYKQRYKVKGTSEWTLTKSMENHKSLHALAPGTEYVWQVKSFCDIKPVVSSDWSEKQFFTTKDLRLSDQATDEMAFNVYPNPVSSSATISFSLNEDSPVIIEIMDVNGRSLKVIVQREFPAGSNEVIFNRKSLVAGIYFLQLKTNEGVLMKKVVILD